MFLRLRPIPPKTIAAATRAAVLERAAVERLNAAHAQGLTVRHLPPDDLMLVNEWAYCRSLVT